jgi:DNA-binding NarL/FixJ family response regulator
VGEKGGLSLSPTAERTAVLLDPHPLWLDAVQRVLAKHGVTIVGRTSNPDSALALVEEFQPTILVAEPAGEGITCLRRACARVPGLKAIALAASDDCAQVQAAFAAGAAAYVVKTAHSDDVGVAVRQAFVPSLFLPDTTEGTAVSGAAAHVETDPAVASLTKREREILRLVAEGHSNGQLARMLWVTEQTVKFHLSNIYRKLAVANRTEAGRWAQVHGLLSPSAGESMAAEA